MHAGNVVVCASAQLPCSTVLLRRQLNPLFKVERVQAVQSLPRNASNKIMRRTLRDELLKQQQQQQQPRSKL